MEHSPLPWAVRETSSGGIIIVDASNQQVAILCQPGSSIRVGDNREANSIILLGAVNRQVIISDKMIQAIKAKNLQHRQTRFDYASAPALAILFEEAVWQVDKLLTYVEQLNIIIEEILRDKGVLDQAAIPILQVREDNRQMKDTLVKILDIYEGGPSSCIERTENMAVLAYEAIGRKPELGSGYTYDEDGDGDDEDYTYTDSSEM